MHVAQDAGPLPEQPTHSGSHGRHVPLGDGYVVAKGHASTHEPLNCSVVHRPLEPGRQALGPKPEHALAHEGEHGRQPVVASRATPGYDAFHSNESTSEENVRAGHVETHSGPDWSVRQAVRQLVTSPAEHAELAAHCGEQGRHCIDSASRYMPGAHTQVIEDALST